MEKRKEREKAFHDVVYEDHSRWKVVDKYYAITAGRERFYQDFVRRHSPGRRVLDYGCGQGWSSLALAELGARVSGIDISDTGIAHAQEAARARNLVIDFRTMDAETLEFPDCSFDLVCGTAILHHLDLRRAFAEVARVLQPGGVAIFMEPLGHNPLINLYRRLTPQLRTVDEHPLTMADFAMAEAFFDRVDLRAYHLSTLAAVPFRRWPGIFRPVLAVLERLDAGLFRTLPISRRYAWYAVAILHRQAA
ncbi:MAG TPA: class I SAM-dependent methyltransferase [Arthrobacter bacterium]|nr:class I SAM-dependent methyltransferase [Arthrobacter sp.]